MSVGEFAPSPTKTHSSDLPAEFVTLGAMLVAQATKAPDRVAFTFLKYRRASKAERSSTTNAGLLARAIAIAARLQQISQPGDRVLILCPPGLSYIAAFFGCQLAGMVAVPAHPPRNAKHLGRLEAIVRDAGASAVLTVADLEAQLDRWSAKHDAKDPSRTLPNTVSVDGIVNGAAHTWTAPDVQSDDLAFLQYTSGTTGSPKGVMVTHRQVMENIGRIDSCFPKTQRSRGIFWLPPYHDMGLVGAILYPLMYGIPTTLMAPAAFLQRPLRWLQALSAECGTITTAPNFAWQLCVDAAKAEDIAALDLSSLRFALSGAEPVRATTVAALAKTFRPCGFDTNAIVPVYGMAET
ncbi:MAG: AMP-binding protein, partial [Pseudomonadota bacterium]